MKKILFAAIAIVMLTLQTRVMGQDCDAIVAPFLQQRGFSADTYPADKFEYRCHFSQNTFYFCDQVPSNAQVFDLNELTDLTSDQKVESNMLIDLNTLSYYRYNWSTFQARDNMHHIYFRLGFRNGHRYLALRTPGEAMNMCDLSRRNSQ